MDTPTIAKCVAGGWLSNLTWRDIFCYGTALVVPLLPIPATVKSWITKELGLGGRWPDPTVAAFLCNAAWFVFGRAQNSDEAFCLNLYGGMFQVVYFVTFLALCTGAERTGALKSMGIAVLLLVLTVPIANDHAHVVVELHKAVCMFYGMSAAALPLVEVILHGNNNMEVLPHWLASSISLVHGAAWSFRGVLIKNYYMAVQNATGLICSAVFLTLPFWWAQPTAEDTGDEYEQLPDGADSSSSTHQDDNGTEQDDHGDGTDHDNDADDDHEDGTDQLADQDNHEDGSDHDDHEDGTDHDNDADGTDHDDDDVNMDSEGSSLKKTVDGEDLSTHGEETSDLSKNLELQGIKETVDSEDSNPEDEDGEDSSPDNVDALDLNKNSEASGSKEPVQEAATSAAAPATPNAED